MPTRKKKAPVGRVIDHVPSRPPPQVDETPPPETAVVESDLVPEATISTAQGQQLQQQMQPAEIAPGMMVSPGTSLEYQTELARNQCRMMYAMSHLGKRDYTEIENEIIEECNEVALADDAFYDYQRGVGQVQGASIRLIEVIVAHWGHIESNWRPIGQKFEDVWDKFCETPEKPRRRLVFVCSVEAWDYRTNRVERRTIDIPMEQYIKKGTVLKPLDDPRDQREWMANVMQRQKRECIKSIVPRRLQDKAISTCKATLATHKVTPSRIDAMIERFDDFGVSREALEAWIEEPLHPRDRGNGLGPVQFGALMRRYKSIEGEAEGNREELVNEMYANVEPAAKTTNVEPAAKTTKKKTTKKTPTKKAETKKQSDSKLKPTGAKPKTSSADDLAPPDDGEQPPTRGSTSWNPPKKPMR